MPNNLVFNHVASELQVQIFGLYSNNAKAIAVDTNGNLLLSGTVTVSGGAVNATVTGGTIDQLLAGTVTVTGGTISTVSALSAGTVTVTGGTINTLLAGTIDVVSALSAGTVTVTGGTINTVSALSAGTVTVTGGTISTVSALSAGTVTVTGGTINTLLAGTIDVVSALSAGTVTITGGTIQAIPVFTSNSATLTVGTTTVDSLNQNTATQKVYSYYVTNLSSTDTVTAWLEIAPVDSATYYTPDSAGVATITPSTKAVLVAKQFLNYTKLRLVATASSSVEAWYNAQS